MQSSSSDRRRYERNTAEVACKVLRANVARYLSARSVDVSQGGALIELRTASPIANGESVKLGLAWAGEAMLSRHAVVRAKVIRVTPMHGGSQRVAVAFDEPQIEAATIVSSEPKATQAA